jgi:pimeloyl-ACP methyl ester carboxylesterase
MAMAMAERLPRGHCHIIPDQRHMTPLEVPDLVAALIAGRPRAAEAGIAAQ